MIESVISCYKDVELYDIIDYDNGDIEICLYDFLNKGIDFENDVLSIIEHLKLYYTNHKFEFEVYNPKELNREDEGYELAFVKIIEH